MTTMPRRIFLSYCHVDEAYKKELEAHLSPLLLLEKVSSWSDRNMHPGTLLFKEIQKNIENAEIIFLLITSDYLHSSSCQDEMKIALSRHERGISITIPVITRPCHWQILPLGDVLATPKDGAPISTSRDRDLAWVEVVAGLREILQNWSPSGEQIPEETAPAALEASPENSEVNSSTVIKWVNRKASNDEAWASIIKGLAEDIATSLESTLPGGLQHNVRVWGSKIIVDIKNDKYTTTKRLIVEDMTGYVGYSGYQFDIYPTSIQGLNGVTPATYRWANADGGINVLSNTDGSKTLAASRLAQNLADQIATTNWGKPSKVEARRS